MDDYIIAGFASAHKSAAPGIDGDAGDDRDNDDGRDADADADAASDDQGQGGGEVDDDCTQSLTMGLAAATAEAMAAAGAHKRKMTLLNLPYNTNEDHLRDFCEDFGEVAEVKMPQNASGSFVGFAVVTFESEAEADLAANDKKGRSFQGRELRTQLHSAPNAAGSGRSKGKGDSRYFVDQSAAAALRAGTKKKHVCYLCAGR